MGLRLVVLFLTVCALPLALSAETPRLALVVGNAAYDGDAVLRNPVNDATDVAAALKLAGWEVTLITDADRRAFTRGIVAWGDKLAAAKNSSALFYYAGHGMQVDGSNFLLPVKTSFDTLSDIKLDAVNVNDVSVAIEGAGVQVSLIILDACRNNPFAKGGTRSVGMANRGLSVVQSAGGAKGSAIMFSTSPGDVAEDGSGRNGVFTAALLKQINTDLKLEDMFKKVTTEVRASTGDKQKPWINTSIGADFYLLSERIRQANAAEAAKAAAAEAQKAAEARQAELERLTSEVRTAEAARADALKKQLEAAQREVETAKAAQAQADTIAASLAAKAASQAAEAARPKGKVRFATMSVGQVYWGSSMLGSVGPNAPLYADTLPTGPQEFRFESGGVTETKSVTVTTAAYSTLFFGPMPEATASQLTSITLKFDTAQKLPVEVKAIPLGSSATETARTLESGVNVLEPGNWVLSARLSDDTAEAWKQTVQVRSGTDVSVILPLVDYSDPFQLKQLKTRKAALNAKLPWAISLDWLKTGAMVLTGTFDAAFDAFIVSSLVKGDTASLAAGGWMNYVVIAAANALFVWELTWDTGKETIQGELYSTDQKIQILESRLPPKP